MTIVVGHLGGIAGALHVGTLGVLVCHTAGLGAIVAAAVGLEQRPA